MSGEEQERLKKLKEISKKGINPYPHVCQRTHICQRAVEDFDKLTKGKKEIVLAGRIKSIRSHGKAAFAHIDDGSGAIQVYFKEDLLGKEKYELFKNLIDIGDFIEVNGILFKTHKGEKTLQIQDWRLLAKTLLPLPEKWHGIRDKELKFRKRYLDLLANPETRELFNKRSLIIKTIRDFFDRHGFLEVETPILQPIPGGAAACPFVTHHNALDIDLYLRIAPELYLKRLIIGGYEKVYEISRCFRNEGIDYAHNPEFTQIEFYQAYVDYNDLMKLTEEFFKELLSKVPGKIKKPPYPKITFRDALIKYAQIDIKDYKTRDELAKKANELGLEIDKTFGHGKILDELYKERVRPKLIDPIFLIDHPVELSPLAKKHRDNPRYTERFQLLINGLEVCNAFTELNDPIDQEERFRQQQKLLERGDKEAQRLDLDFIEALKYGMPPTAGEGIGIDRLVAILTDQHSLKEVILFPTMKPK